jgi:hypothetical protein
MYQAVIATFMMGTLTAAWGTEADDSIAYLQAIRSQLQLPELTISADLSFAAQMHANYMGLNFSFSHDQSSDLAGFYAEQPSERCKKAGYIQGCAEVILRGVRDWPEAISRFLRGPYHRFLLLNPDAVDIGLARYLDAKQEQIYVLTLGNGRQDRTQYSTVRINTKSGKMQRTTTPNSPAAPIRYIVWPQDLAATHRFEPLIKMGEEVPDPLSPTWPVSGYLLSIHANKQFSIKNWTIIDPEGNVLESEQVDGQSAGGEPGHSWILKTRQSFELGKVYQVQAEVSEFQGQSQTLKWRFTTKGELLIPEEWRQGLNLKLGERRRLHAQSVSGALGWQGSCVEFASPTLESIEVTAKKLSKGCYIEVQDLEFTSLKQRIELLVH